MNLSHCIYLMAVWDRKAGSVLKLSLIFISFLLIYTSMTCFLFPKKRVWEIVKFYFIQSFNSFFFFLMEWSSLKDPTEYLKTIVLWNMKNSFLIMCTTTFCLLQNVVGLVWSSEVRLPQLVLALSFASWVTLDNQWNSHASVSSIAKIRYQCRILNKLIHVKHLE